MSKAVISIAIVLAVVLAAAGVWWAGLLDPWLGANTMPEMEEQTEQTQQQPPSELTTGSDTSNEALDEDLSALDAQLEAYNESSSELDASLNDEAVAQDDNF